MDKLDSRRLQVAELEFWKESQAVFTDEIFTHIRCLALGLPTDSFQAGYQLAYLLELAQYLKVKPENISHWDPVFTEEDTKSLKLLGHVVEEIWTVPEGTVLYFMPHAELSMTNDIIDSEKPRWILANNLVHHTDRYTLQKLLDTYPLIAHLVHSLNSSETKPESDGFEKVTKRRNRKQFQPPTLSYDYSTFYFDKANVTQFKENVGKQVPWNNSFSDLALTEII